MPNRPVSAYQRANAKPGGGAGGQPAQAMPAGVMRVGLPIASSSDGAGIGVAILDTGIDLPHQDLLGIVDAFSAFGPSCQDDAGHGTHVAGIVGARDNNVDVVGVAPAATLFCVKVLDPRATDPMRPSWPASTGSWRAALVTPLNPSDQHEPRASGTVDDNPAHAPLDRVT